MSERQSLEFSSRNWGYEVADAEQVVAQPIQEAECFEKFTEFMEDDFVGSDVVLSTPYGARRMTYADATASGRSMKSIEKVILEHVLPLYGNTHTSSSACGRQTTQFFEEARQLIKNCTNATDKDTVIFAGNGCTGAIHKFANIMMTAQSISRKQMFECTFPGCSRKFGDRASVLLHSRTHSDGEASGFKPRVCGDERTDKNPNAGMGHDSQQLECVVFHGPKEHHSNILIWRELSNVTAVEVPATRDGVIDVDALLSLLRKYSHARLKIASFSAASNVTGILEDVDKITQLCHEHNCLSCWDYAAAGPHSSINMNPIVAGHKPAMVAKDAVFISPHKYAGGPGTPGILIMKRDLLHNAAPVVPGGGTVFYVTSDHHRYLENPEEREEGGTKNIIGAIRAGLTFQMQAAAGYARIMARERAITQRVMDRLSKNHNIVILGSKTSPRVPIYSLMFRGPYGSKRYLHWSFVATILNDLFGVQVRGGCMCAGPYGHHLLRIDATTAHDLENLLVDKHEMLRPGFVRVSMGYYWTDDMVDGVIDALLFIADHGHLFLRDYTYYIDSGEYRHNTLRKTSPHRRWLHDVSYQCNGLNLTASLLVSPPKQEGLTLAQSLVQAITLAKKRKPTPVMQSDPNMILGIEESQSHLRWYYVDGEEQPPSNSNSTNGDQESAQQQDTKMETDDDDADDADGVGVEEGTMQLVVRKDTLIPETSCPLLTLVQNNNDTDNDTDNQGNGNVTEQQQQQPKEDPQTALATTPATKASDSAASDRCEDSTTNPANPTKRAKRNKLLWPELPKSLTRHIGEAIQKYDMIKQGDRILVGVSGGKDSLTLLHALCAFQRKSPVKFELAAVTVHPNFTGFDPTPLISYMATLGITYFFEKQDLMAEAKKAKPSSICAWCSRMKRGILYTVARRENYNVLALGQHLDDLAESFLMSAFHNGKLRTMKANYVINAGDLRVIRPLASVRERQTREFAVKNHLPIIFENCPACFEAPQERYRIKTVLAQQEHLFPQLMSNLKRTMEPLVASAPHEKKPDGTTVISNNNDEDS